MDVKYIINNVLPELHDINEIIKLLQKRKRAIEKQDKKIKLYYPSYRATAEPKNYNINFEDYNNISTTRLLF